MQEIGGNIIIIYESLKDIIWDIICDINILIKNFSNYIVDSIVLRFKYIKYYC